MKLRISTCALLATVASLGGCITNYQYQARGQVLAADQAPLGAVIYWRMDDGRLWYGRRYRQLDSDATLRVCRRIPKAFELTADQWWILPMASGDRFVGRSANGDSGASAAATAGTASGTACGLILTGGKPAGPVELTLGVRPMLAITCDNADSPDRYPRPGHYQFEGVARMKAAADDPGPDPCP